MKTQKLIIAITLLLGFSSCHKEYFDSGSLITEERIVEEEYSQILMRGSFDIYLVEGELFDLKIECGEKKLEYLDTYVIGDKLYIIERNNHVANDKQNKVFVNESFFTKIEIEGSGDIEGDLQFTPFLELYIDGSGDIDLNCSVENNVDIYVDGSGDIKLNGEAETLSVEIDGSGDVDCRFLPVEEAVIFIDGSGDVKVNVSDYLFVQIYGSGDVRYIGDPIIEINDNGSGEVDPY